MPLNTGIVTETHLSKAETLLLNVELHKLANHLR